MLKDQLTKKLIVSLIIILLLISILYFLIIYITSPQNNEKSTILISLLSFGATLSAPVVAYIFYDNWKAQTKFNRVTTNILELQKVLHDYVTELKFLRNRITFPYSRNKFETEDDYLNNLKKLLDLKFSEITSAERLKYESQKLVSVIRTDTQNLSRHIDENLAKLDDLINKIYRDIREFNHNYFVFINHYYKDEIDLKNFLKTDEYKNLTYKISSTRETNNVIKTNLKLALTLEEEKISPETTLKIHQFIQIIDSISGNLLKEYESSFTN